MTDQNRNIIHPTGETEAIVGRNAFYVSIARAAMIYLPMLIAVLIISILSNVWLFTRQPEPRYFAVSEGKLIPMAPLNVPYVSEHHVLQWAATALSKSYAFDFKNYRHQFNDVRNYFTADGYDNFKGAMQKQRLEAVTTNRLVSSAVVSSAPVIVGTGVSNGVFLWKVRAPMVVTLSSSGQQATARVMVTLIVARVETYENPNGIAISQFIEEAI